jgi:hypothetical protein
MQALLRLWQQKNSTSFLRKRKKTGIQTAFAESPIA